MIISLSSQHFNNNLYRTFLIRLETQFLFSPWCFVVCIFIINFSRHYLFFIIYKLHANLKINIFVFKGMAGGSLSKCQSPPPVITQTRRTATPDNPDPAEVITEVNINTHSILVH